MDQPIGVRLPKDVLKKIEQWGKKEMRDRSTVIRMLVLEGYRQLIKKKAVEEYLRGEVTFSEAASRAGLTLWEMEKFLVEQGYKSEYSVEDLEREIGELEKFK